MISFTYPLIFIAVPILLGIWYIFFRERWGIVAPNTLITSYLRTPGHIWLLWGIRALLVITLATILAQGKWILTQEDDVLQKRNTLIIMDISRSMLSEDLTPSRMTVAKSTLQSFLLSRNQDIISMIIFAGKPFIAIARSEDRSGIITFIDTISPGMILQDKPGLSGTNIGDAILLANNTLSGSTGEKTIILLTDGTANLGIDPLIAARESAALGIKIFPIGIGTRSGEPLFYTDSEGNRVFFYDETGAKIINDLEEEFLQNIAQITGGKYLSARDSAGLSASFSDLDASMALEYKKESKTRVYPLGLIAILIFLLLLGIESYTRKRLIKKYNLSSVEH